MKTLLAFDSLDRVFCSRGSRSQRSEGLHGLSRILFSVSVSYHDFSPLFMLSAASTITVSHALYSHPLGGHNSNIYKAGFNHRQLRHKHIYESLRSSFFITVRWSPLTLQSPELSRSIGRCLFRRLSRSARVKVVVSCVPVGNSSSSIYRSLRLIVVSVDCQRQSGFSQSPRASLDYN